MLEQIFNKNSGHFLQPVRFIQFFKHSYDKEKEYTARKLIGFSKEEMFTVVADVRHYKQFLPFCTKSTILCRMPKQLLANLEIGFPPIVENYTSTVTIEKPHLVQAICTDARLFKYLETTWQFNPGLYSNPKSCITDFYIRFEFKSALYSHLASIVFDRLVHQMEKAFLEEAKRRYGKPSVTSHELTPMKIKS